MTSEDVRTPAAPQVPPGSGAPPHAPAAPIEPTPEFTELTARRLGPVRAFFVRHPVVMDVLVMAWFGVPAIFSLLLAGVDAPGGRLTTSRLVTAIVCSLATVVVLWWRRRAPVVALVVITVLAVIAAVVTYNTSGLELAVAFGVYAVAASGGPRRAWPAFGGATLVVVAAVVWGGAALDAVTISAEDGVEITALTYQITGASVVVMFNLVAIAIGTSVHNRRQHVASIIDRGNRLALERDQREQIAVVDERNRIARELHDVVAHSLTVMITLSDGAAGIAERDPTRARSTMQDVSETGRAALADMRRVLGVLRTDNLGASLEPSPTQGVDDLVSQFRGAGLRVELVRAGGPLPADSGLRLAVYRIVQEALTNVLRYAPLSPAVTVGLDRTPSAVVVDVSNLAGPGNHPQGGGSGRGLIGMRERVAVFGGTLEAGATPQGWRVRALLPWEDEA
ncbi:sensor histidine kinase [Serinibacter arcticus]|uniref:histidine kinase n=1 Tax=Serinibacter arcticus TaxID=1655435 RepID=A0A4Z1DZ82_9MICO|nr:histidine kinase [Serinibacter arcticus]TGO04178.1 putative two-component system sensor kinase [Serinibacter arcticus]